MSKVMKKNVKQSIPDLKLDFNEPMMLDLFVGDKKVASHVCIPGTQLKICNTDKDMKLIIKCIDLSMNL